jgi:hypothetical protein
LTEHGCDQFARARWLVLLKEWKGVNSCRFQGVANIQDSVEHLLRLYEGRHFEDVYMIILEVVKGSNSNPNS